jgi:hypothetical protein
VLTQKSGSVRRPADGALSIERVAGTQFALEDLARAGGGQGVDEFDRARRLVAGDAPPGVLAQLVRTDVGAGFEDDLRVDPSPHLSARGLR